MDWEKTKVDLKEFQEILSQLSTEDKFKLFYAAKALKMYKDSSGATV